MFLDYINLPWEIVWVFALIFIVLSFLETDDKKMFILLAIGSLFYWIHFLWLWLITAAYINFFDIAKNLAVTQYKKNSTLFWLFFIAYLIIGYKTAAWETMSYLFTIASITSLFAAFYLRWISLRIVYFASIMIQLIYTIIWNSLTWSIINILFLLSITSSMYLLYKRRWFLWKVRYASYVFYKNFRKFMWFRYKRIKFLR